MEMATRTSDPDQNSVGTTVRNLKRAYLKKYIQHLRTHTHLHNLLPLNLGREMCGDGFRCFVLFCFQLKVDGRALNLSIF